MFAHLLVPLDGSSLAEAALPSAAFLAGALKARVTLLHIVEADAPEAVHGQRHLTRAEEAEEYLEDIGRRYFPADARLSRHVHTAAMKDVADGIVMHEAEFAAEAVDLVVLCTHGKGGLRNILFGSIAQQVAASGCLPVLLIRPEAEGQSETSAWRTILAPTDADPAHARGLDAALGLARALGAKLELLGVAATPDKLTGRKAVIGRFMPGATQALLEMTGEDLKEYLREKAAACLRVGIAVSARLERGDPAEAIVRTAETTGADVIVMGTHGKAGFDAFWAGSMAARVLTRTTRPVLLVPA